MSFPCPKCGGKTSCKDSRQTDAGRKVRRRYQCLKCGLRFKTEERLDHPPIPRYLRDQIAEYWWIDMELPSIKE